MFLEKPTIPAKNVKYVLVAADICERLAPGLLTFGVKAIPSPWSPSLPWQVRFHPDMNCRHLGENRFLVFDDARGTEALRALGAEIECVPHPRKPEYPFDAALNALVFGNRFICNPSAVSLKLSEEFSSIRQIRVRQGYCACSVAPVDENTVLTGDAGISRALVRDGVRVVGVDAGRIRLPGYGNGFIGGCCGLIAPRLVAFTGKEDGLVCGGSISEVLSGVGAKAVFLTEEPMFDCGGIVPVAE